MAATATLSLLCAAAFVFVMDRYNVLCACLTIASFWLIVTLALISIYVANRRRSAQAAIAAQASRPSLLADPFVIATGVQIVHAIGIKRVAALAAVAGAAMALASKPGPANDAKREANLSKRRSSTSLLLWRLLWPLDIKLDDAHERKNEKDNQDCSKSPNWVVAPTSAVRPGGQRTDHEEDEDDKDNETHVRPSSCLRRSRGPSINAVTRDWFRCALGLVRVLASIGVEIGESPHIFHARRS
jgi:hypothetical protein